MELIVVSGAMLILCAVLMGMMLLLIERPEDAAVRAIRAREKRARARYQREQRARERAVERTTRSVQRALARNKRSR